jgi:hypothetical protein
MAKLIALDALALTEAVAGGDGDGDSDGEAQTGDIAIAVDYFVP